MRDKIASRELRASRVTVEAETPAEVRDMLPRRLVYEDIHEFVGIDPSTEQLPVATEVASAKCGRHNHRVMRLGEGRPARHGSPRVLSEIVIRF
jgi:hypothetical protein